MNQCETPLASFALSSISVFLISMHVGSAFQDHSLFRWYLVPAPAVISLTHVISTDVEWSVVKANRKMLTCIAILCGSALLAWGGQVLVAFCVAYVSTLLVFVPLFLVKDKVKYDIDDAYFVISRSTTYASLRAFGTFFAQRGWISAPLVRLLPLLVSTLETAGMYALGVRASYSFSPENDTTVFFRYAALKAAMFVLVPELEERFFRIAPSY